MEIFAGILPGMLEMPNSHPLFVHFPIALLCGFLLMEALGAIMDKCSMRGAATWMLYLGTLGAVVTVISGLYAAGGVEHGKEVHALMSCHMKMAIITLILSLILSVWRIAAGGKFSAGWRTVHFIIGVIMVITLFSTADKGATMVYKHGVGIEKARPADAATGSEAETDGHHIGGGHHTGGGHAH